MQMKLLPFPEAQPPFLPCPTRADLFQALRYAIARILVHYWRPIGKYQIPCAVEDLGRNYSYRLLGRYSSGSTEQHTCSVHVFALTENLVLTNREVAACGARVSPAPVELMLSSAMSWPRCATTPPAFNSRYDRAELTAVIASTSGLYYFSELTRHSDV
jgi:hypothetical protein